MNATINAAAKLAQPALPVNRQRPSGVHIFWPSWAPAQ
jgi:hypothetical protein